MCIINERETTACTCATVRTAPVAYIVDKSSAQLVASLQSPKAVVVRYNITIMINRGKGNPYSRHSNTRAKSVRFSSAFFDRNRESWVRLRLD